ncbi:hypothetical protein FHY02_003376 [Sphingomonas sp. BK069]|nr:hypothetical protein [Sphingomonas sp. BK069]
MGRFRGRRANDRERRACGKTPPPIPPLKGEGSRYFVSPTFVASQAAASSGDFLSPSRSTR